MYITYNKSFEHESVVITTAKCQLPLFGRWTEITVTSYCLLDKYRSTQTAINFCLRPMNNSDLKCSSLDATQNSILPLSRKINGILQRFEQNVDVPMLVGQLLDYSELRNGNIPSARFVVDSLLRSFESIVETIRQYIRKNLASDIEIRNLSLATLHHRFGGITRKTIESFLGQINWRLMLEKSDYDEDQANVIEYSTAHNPPRFCSILDEASNDIPLIHTIVARAFDHRTIANLKAIALLKKVCGKELGLEFEQTGKITVKEREYTFVIEPGKFVFVTDPNGKSAHACIHTLGFQINPIDEICVSYLYIRHKLKDWMKEAVLHRVESGFQKFSS